MCTGFGLIATKDGRYLFCEPDNNGNVSHTLILDRACMRDSRELYKRPFIRIEFTKWTEDSYRVDESGTLPGWAEDNADEIKEKCTKVMLRVKEILPQDTKK